MSYFVKLFCSYQLVFFCFIGYGYPLHYYYTNAFQHAMPGLHVLKAMKDKITPFLVTISAQVRTDFQFSNELVIYDIPTLLFAEFYRRQLSHSSLITSREVNFLLPYSPQALIQDFLQAGVRSRSRPESWQRARRRSRSLSNCPDCDSGTFCLNL